ncbi:MLP-like protein 34 isoform 2 [Hibiscus syriacus]|uniref:MLP-like protein 34 isoform 2 n=1 Tax=Hibiscus syriacus TaxID=106335 RepID=A0A6A3CRD0_HIBSY|nr:kirola-like [Hibiscus syriacus]KAE8730092.1 MLP-like protein 34 isoform 2 [Hibiscus syriacus]
MAQLQRMECQFEIKSSADKFFDVYKNKPYLMPKLSNQKVTDIKLLQGDWNSEGSFRLWHIDVAGKTEPVKEMIEKMDDTNRTIVYKLVGGEIMNAYKTWKTILNVTSMGEGSLVKWTMEFEKQNENIPDPVKYGEFLTAWAKNVDAYLLNAQ